MVMAAVATTLPELLFQQVERRGDEVALRKKEFGIWNRISWTEYGRMVRIVAAGLLSLGLKRGDRVAILGENRPEWVYCSLGAMAAGGASCGIYPTSAADQIQYLMGHSEAKILFAENEEQVDKILEIIDDLGDARIVVWDPKGLWGFSHDRVIFFDEFIKIGSEHLEANPDLISHALSEIDPDDTAVIIYTSGTTGRPKGAMLSHKNIIFMTRAFVGILESSPDDEMISYLPLAHIYENLISLFLPVWSGGKVNFVESLDTLAQNLREVSPTIFASVPRIWEKFASAIEIRMSDSTILKRILYRAAVYTGLKYVRNGAGTRGRLTWALLYWPMYWTVLYHLKRQLGFERVRWAICGAAPASPELFEFYNALGVPLREGYGQTESTGVIAFQRMERPRWGYVGEPVTGVNVRIAEDGEILASGGGVFKGYFKAPELTSETVIDGWLHTGDVGILEDGYLKIMDRKKDILITAGGKNITPAFIENKLKFSSYIQDAVVIGDGRKYLTALVLIDEDNVTKFATDNRVPFTTFADLTQNPEINKLIEAEVSKANSTLSRVEAVKKFALLPRRFYEEDGDVTPTKKVKRRFVEERYKELIESLY
jgi:long-chain acyl-CoA synthetase